MNIFFIRGRMRAWSVLLVLLLAPALGSTQSIAPVIAVHNGPNSAEQQAKPYVVLVSLDGFRYDYAKQDGAKNLLALARSGASAPQGMIPAFPSFTFPNHYTIVTGLYPEHHGIVANSFFDPARKQRFDYNDSKTNADGSWYGGTPLWVLAEQQGMRSASFFWPGSEAEIMGKRPSYYLRYDDKFPDEKRVDQVLAWLQLPPDQRPHFIMLYYSNVDHAGHTYGPDAPETGEAVRHVDELIGKLVAGLGASHLPVDLIVVSDHGMENEQGDWITLEKYTDLSQFVTVGPLMYPKTEADAEKAYHALDGVSDKFKVYRRANYPSWLHYNANPRSGDPIVLPTGPYMIRARQDQSSESDATQIRGMHGYDPRTMPSMKAIFFAAGPDIRTGVAVAPFENVDLYPLIAKILGLRIGPVDGKLSALQNILKGPVRR